MPQISTKLLSRSAACAVLLTFLLLVCPARVAAIPISEYEQNIKNAIVSLEEFVSDDEEEEIPEDYEERLNQALAEIRRTLPRNQTIESDGEVYNADNTWLHQALDELRQEAHRSERIQQIIARLTTMDMRVVERQQQTQTLESKDAAKKRLETILARPEYESIIKGPNALTRLWRDFIEWIKKFLPKPRTTQPGSGAWLEAIAKVFVIVGAAALVVFLCRLLIGRLKRTKKIKAPRKKQPRIVLGERLEPEQTATDLLSEAEALARNGDLRAAIRKAYIALLVELGDRKIISLAQHKTNRDYLNALRGLPPLHSSMRGLTDSFERHWYGFADANQTDWQNFRDGYLAALHKGQ